MSRHAYLRPRTLDEALALRAALPGARFVAGGTDLLVQMRRRRVEASTLVSLRGVDELRGIQANGSLRIGALTTIAELAAQGEVRLRFPVLVEAALVMGSTQVRNVGTVGGNLANASPAADLAPPLIALGARVELQDERGKRALPVAEFFTGPGQTALRDAEIVTAIVIDGAAPVESTAFQRLGRVRMDLAIASVAARGEILDGQLLGVRLAAGAVAPVPLRLAEVEAAVEGREPTPALLDEAARLAARVVAPITDLRASADYRRHLVSVFVRRARARIAGNRAGAPTEA